LNITTVDAIQQWTRRRMADHLDETLIARVTAAATSAVLVELGYAKKPLPAPEPEFMTAAQLRRQVLNCSPNTFRKLLCEPDFPKAVLRGSTPLHNVAAVRRWLAAREVG
jgi:hypothetical protein